MKGAREQERALLRPVPCSQPTPFLAGAKGRMLFQTTISKLTGKLFSFPI
jgi:hypothetical protein